ncbi:hypothetical protein KSS87_007589 [Heliosperma pusillum]|nr:hypothetical protein KSS87_008602 [Heliosperma pusillum]KAH9622406.1 hypothetical protein KSS87_007589 [Heliosperma pusillum]
MFGRIRSSPSLSSSSMVEWFEQERPPSKLLKDDSLSIFEATLMKLKQGSRHCLSSEHDSSAVSHDSMDIESSMNVLQDLSANSGVTVSGDSSSCVSMNSETNRVQEKGVGVSIQFLFSRYTSLQKKQGSSSCDSDPLSNVSSCVSDSESTGCSKI